MHALLRMIVLLPTMVGFAPLGTKTSDTASGVETSATDSDTDIGWLIVSVGVHHTCGVTTSGSVECWGLDSSGESTPPAR